MSKMDFNLWERWRGIDQWPEAAATVTNIEQPFADPKHDFLSVVSFTFKDKTGEYFAGTFQMRTQDFTDDFMTGNTVKIRYYPTNPNKTWYEDDYFRSGFGLWQNRGFPILMLSIVLFFLLTFALITIFKRH
ncbi:MAG TPA: DUF3592 domain-containing protein [Terracidiphilus sp.]|jgi:hypothetical protein